MGICLHKDEESKPTNFRSADIKDVSIMTFAGPQNNLESFQQNLPPTFSDPVLFCQNNGSISLASITNE